MSDIPGISLVAEGEGDGSIVCSGAVPDAETDSVKRARCNQYRVALGSWLEATVRTRCSAREATFSDEKISVLFDGYLTDVVGAGARSTWTAEDLAALYRSGGTSFLPRLRGSYTGLIIDRQASIAYLFNDRAGSRPCFYRRGAGAAVAIGPEVQSLSRLPPAVTEIDWQAVTEFLIFGSYYQARTIFKDICKLPQGSVATLRLNSFDLARYWSLRFSPADEAHSESQLVEECDALLREAGRRMLRRVRNPVLLLSGGTDSRVILGVLRAEQADVAVASFGTDTGDDFEVAAKVAKACGLPLREYLMSLEAASSHFSPASIDGDCRAETVDTPSLGAFHVELAGSFDACINGDECFGWRKRVLTHESAFDAVGLFDLAAVNGLGDWFDRPIRRVLGEQIAATKGELRQACGDSEPNNLKDWLYYHSRLGNMLNAFSARRLRLYEQARPLIDEDVIDFVTRLPLAMREDKRLLRRVLELKYPQLYALGLSCRDSLPTAETFRKQFRVDPVLRDFVLTQLTERFDSRLAALVNPRRFGHFVSTVADGLVPTSRRRRWIKSIPGAWRALPPVRSRVHPVSLVLRMLQIQLYLHRDKA